MSCYGDCTENTQWYEFGKRKACFADCDQQAYQVQADAVLEQTQAQGSMIKWIIPALVFITILLLIAKYKKWI